MRRAYLPKPDGRQRPLGGTTLADKLVQRATTGTLNAIYETDFLGFSSGFRPGRSQHNALDARYIFGFTHRGAKKREGKNFTVLRQTRPKRLSAKLAEVKA